MYESVRVSEFSREARKRVKLQHLFNILKNPLFLTLITIVILSAMAFLLTH